MKTMLKKMTTIVGLVLVGTILTATASAECLSYLPKHNAGAVVSPQSWSGATFRPASLLMISEHDSDDVSIVGFWNIATIPGYYVGLGAGRLRWPRAVRTETTTPPRPGATVAYPCHSSRVARNAAGAIRRARRKRDRCQCWALHQ